MRTLFFILIAIVALGFTSCDLTSESSTTPSVTFYSSIVTNKNDTLGVYYTSDAKVYVLDTITVGDTVTFNMYLTSFSNNISDYYMVQSADSVSKIILPDVTSMDSLFLASSKYSQGIFHLKNKVNTMLFPFKYVALKPSLEAKIKFAIVSDANFDYNSFSFDLKTPIVAPKVY